MTSKNNKRNVKKECQGRQTRRLRTQEKNCPKNWTKLDVNN